MPFTPRALHYVFKIADRTKTMVFFREILGMQVLRHEEFKEGCAAACNGPYDNRWSKTMIGYGPEDNHFVIELTYNYNVHNYERGNDFIGIVIKSRESIARAKASLIPVEEKDNYYVIQSPDGYPFYLMDEAQPTTTDPVVKVILASSDLENSLDYWKGFLNMNVLQKAKDKICLGYNSNECALEFQKAGGAVNRAEAYGRIAFSIPHVELKPLEQKASNEERTILKPLVTLDTPGKASVTVVILADPDGHEICFVDDENFRQLSQVDPEAKTLLDRYIKKDNERLAKA